MKPRNKKLFDVFCLALALVITTPAAQAQNLFVSEILSDQISEFAPGGAQSIFATGFTNPEGLAFDSAGNLFVANGYSGNIYKYTPGGVQSTFASGFTGASLQGLAFDSSGNLFAAGGASGNIYKFTPGGAPSTFASGLSNPTGLAFDSAGNLFVADNGSSEIYKFTTGGVRSTFASGAGNPVGLAFDSAGNLFAAGYGSASIYQFTPGGVRSTFATGLSFPTGLAFDSAGNLFALDYGSGNLYKFTPGGARSTFASGLSGPQFLAFQTQIVTTTSDSGIGSLRQVVSNAPAGTTITFAPSLSGQTITLTSGQLLLNKNLAIDASALASGVTISGNHSSRVFEVSGGSTAVLKSLTIANGTDFSGMGGGVAVLGSSSSLLATNCLFIGNVSQGGNGVTPGSGNNGGPGGGGAGLGGAIYSEGNLLTISGCSFITNVAAGGNGGAGTANGFNNNPGGNGGGPNGGLGGAVGQPGNPGGFGGGGGGGAGSFTQGFNGGAGGFGGGGGAGGAQGEGNDGGVGGLGGAYAGSGGAAHYSVSGGGGGGAGLGGAIFASTGLVQIASCSFTGNLASNGLSGPGSFGAGDGASGQGVGGAIFNLNGQLTTQNLTFNGNSATTSNNDANSFIVVTSLADSGPGSLRQVISNAFSGATITFAPGLSGQTITLTSGQLLLNNNLTIDASALPGGISINGNAASRIFNVATGNTDILTALTITNGLALGGFPSGYGGGIYNDGNLTLSNCTLAGSSAFAGGAVYNRNILTINSSTLSENSAAYGGGIDNEQNLIVNNSTFWGNTATVNGGGINAAFGRPVALNFCSLSGNSCATGAGINIIGSGTTINNTIVAGNLGGNNIAGAAFVGSNNLTNGNPLLAPLGNYGGPTQTLPPLPGSPAIDAGNDAATNTFATDQRGYPRIVGPYADIGAVERSPGDPKATPTFSLSAASQSITYGTASITLSGRVNATGPVYPASGEPVVVSINGITVTNIVYDTNGDFNISFPTATIPISAAPYTITYFYPGDGSLNATSDASTTLTVNNYPEAYVFTTLAGLAGVSGSANGTNSSARFGNPLAVAVDSAGNVYVADNENFTIRKITPAGVVTTIAGLAGVSGSADGTNNAARFNYPSAIAVDASGIVYVVDSRNYTIRKLTPAGSNWVVTTLAGQAGVSGSTNGTGSAARFSFANGNGTIGLVVDNAGNLFVTDTGNNTIRKVTPAGMVTTIAGLAGAAGNTDGMNSAARFSGPTGLAVDSAGNLYVSDNNNAEIRTVIPIGTNWVVTTLVTGFVYPAGLAVDNAGNLYVAHHNSDTIQKVTLVGTNWMVTTLAGLAGVSGSADGTGSTARFFDPQGVAIDGNGNLYVADRFNNTIRKGYPPVPPIIVSQPQSLSVGVGASANFTVTASGAPTLGYQWQLNGANVPGATSSTYNIPFATVGSGGNYQVIVTNLFGSVTSSVASLAVYTPVTILTRPQSVQVTVGSSAGFSVVAISSSPLTYQWFLNGTAIPGATNSVFSLANAQLTDNGICSVRVANLAGSVASASAALVVVPAPPPLVTTSSYTIQIQAGLNLIANQLDNGGNTLNEILPVVPDGTLLSKYDNTNGSWTINTYNAALQAWVPSSITLSPGEGAFLTSPSNFSLTFTGTSHVPVLPVNIPAETIWLVSRQTNNVGTYSNIVGAAPTPGAVVYKWNPTNQSYNIFSYSETGWSGGFEPVASVGESMWIGSGGGAPTTVPTAPSISQQPASIIVAQGSTASFTVVAAGTEPLYYQWQLNGNGIPGATNSVLGIPNVQTVNAGSYSVAVNNAVGIANSAIATLAISNFVSLPLNDNFANATSLGSSTNGSVTGSNQAATTEPGEPTDPGGFGIGATVWLSWQPTNNGIARINTIGSGFDTVLGVYTGTNVANLQLVAADDDSAANLCSWLSFNAVAGRTYYFQVGGSYGAMGNIVLSWNLVVTDDQIPHIVTQPQDQTQTNGGPVVLSVSVTNIGVGVSYQWTLNGVTLLGATDATLTLPSVNSDQVGLYVVGVTNTQTLLGVLSEPASVCIFDPGPGQAGNFATVHPSDKFQPAITRTPHDPNIPNDPAPAGGYYGTIIYNSTNSTADPGEPAHCDYPAAHTIWLPWQNTNTGSLTVSTTNNFKAILTVYTTSSSITNLAPLACSASGTTRGESVTFPYLAGTRILIMVDGLAGTSGKYALSWSNTAPPVFTVLPIGQTVSNGGTLTLTTGTAGAAPIGYQWMFNGSSIPNATNSSLVINNFQALNQGYYSVLTRNGVGTNVSAPAPVFLSSPPRFLSLEFLPGLAYMQFAGIANSNYVLQTSTNLIQWNNTLNTNYSPVGIINFFDAVTDMVPQRFYRAYKQ